MYTFSYRKVFSEPAVFCYSYIEPFLRDSPKPYMGRWEFFSSGKEVSVSSDGMALSPKP